MTLRLWTNEVDTVVAESAEDAAKVSLEFSGPSDDEDQEWTAIDDGCQFKIRDEDKGDRTQTAAEWAAENGRGFLCSTEW